MSDAELQHMRDFIKAELEAHPTRDRAEFEKVVRQEAIAMWALEGEAPQ